MKFVTIHAAEADLDDLVDLVLTGDDVVITSGDTPLVRLVPLTRPAPSAPSDQAQGTTPQS